MTDSWIPLHVHSQYSILNSSASVKELAKTAASMGMDALALTDQGNLFGAVEFYKACKAEGIKPIIGCEIALAPESRHEKKRMPGVPAGMPIILLVKDKVGYRNLCKLTSAAYLEGFYYTPRIDRDLLEAHSEGLICLSGGLNSPIGHAIRKDDEEALDTEIAWFKEAFGDDFYLELQRHPMAEHHIEQDGMKEESWLIQNYEEYRKSQELIIEKLCAKGVATVVTNDTHYIKREDWRAHEILMNVQSGEPCEIWERDSLGNPKNRVLNPKRQTMPTHELYFKSGDQIKELFPEHLDAVMRSREIAQKCHFEIDFDTKHYPVFVPPHLEGKELSEGDRVLEAEKYLRELCQQGIVKRYTPERLEKVKAQYLDRDPIEVVKERLDYEMNIIASKGMCDYLLIVWDFIHWAKTHDIPVGPGRGSGAGSIILYLIGITDIEPLRFNLFFERFINPERLSYPDIDVDICMDRRPEVIEYTVQKYGRDKVAQIITFGTMKAKMAIKDVGRVLSVPLNKVNQIAKLVPEDLGMTLEKALDIDPDLAALYQNDAEVTRLLDLAKRLEGSVRNTGIHAAGLIISGQPLTDHIPICNAKDSEIAATQYSMKPVEAVGMLKIDFLGLKTLTSIQKAVDAIGKYRNKQIDWVNLPLDDQPTFDLLNHGKTLGIFQLESGGMQDLARQLHIDKFEEIIAVGALYRPGPMEMIPSFIARKHKREEIEIDHPKMADVLAETYGIMVYQEQVMQIASLLAGYSLGEGDVLRRAMGKKDAAEMGRQRVKFKEGAIAKGVDAELSMHIFDKIEKFASYGFNKSHAAAYGFLTYVTAYLKANYPGEWMAALLTCDRDDITKVSKVIRECQAMHIPILPPDVNESGTEFVSTSKGVRFALSAVKGVGGGIVELILRERAKNGPFESLYNFFERIELSKVGKRVIEVMIEAGAFDFTLWRREEMVASVEPMHQMASQQQKEASKGVLNLFSLIEEEQEKFTQPPKDIPVADKQVLLRREKELLGFYLTGHPMDDYKPLLKRLSCVPLSKITDLEDRAVIRVAFIIETIQTRVSQRSQKKFAILNISDGMERYELPIWPELFEQKGSLLGEGELIYAVLQVDRRDGGLRLQARWLEDLTGANEEMIAACDDAFEKAKVTAQAAQFREKRKEKAEKKEKEEKVASKRVKIELCADSAHLSHILELKKIVADSPGKDTLHIHFEAGGDSLALLHVNEEWGVSHSLDVEKKIGALPSVKAITVD